MPIFQYIYLKAIAGMVRLAQPCPVTSPNPNDVIPIPSRNSNRTIKAHVYRASGPQTQHPSPVLVNFHGSGFVLQWHGSDDYFCRLIAEKTNYTVLDIQYRLGPECPFPGAPNDAEDVVKYVLSRPHEFDLSRLSVSGFSAGGNLALGITTSGAFPKGTFHSVLAYYPPTDLSIDHSAKIAPDPSGTPIPSTMARIFNQCYLAGHDPRDPLVSPALADVNRLPQNTLIITCGCDSLALETEGFIERIMNGREQGAWHIAAKRIDGVNHAWDKSTEEGSEGEKKRDESYAMAIEMLRR